MSNDWKSYVVSVNNLELLLTARNAQEAKSTVLASLSGLSERLKFKDGVLKLSIRRAKGLGN